MVPIPQQEEANKIIDFHVTPAGYPDLGHPGVFSTFHKCCAIIDLGSWFAFIGKQYGPNCQLMGLTEIKRPLPQQFNGMWCRLFTRNGTNVFVMDYDRRDFVIFNIESDQYVGRWMLPVELPDDAQLDRVESTPWEDDFKIIYTIDGNEHTIVRSFSDQQWGTTNPPAQVVE